ncbi:hypothetical protein CKO13_12090, partial [Halorhodospira neutriphila]|nr:hypothetical protein [Halorhodospira neutriphila]
MRERCAAQRRGDGLLWLTPARRAGAEGGWDGYMHLSVYNAWTAGLLAATAHGHPGLCGRPPEGLGRLAWRAAPGRVEADEQAGLLRLRQGRTDLLLSTRGQPVQGYSRRQADLRAAAGLALHLERAGRPLLPAPPRLPAEALRACPCRAGWTPLVACGRRLYGLARLEAVAWERTDRGLRLKGEGRPVALCRAEAQRGGQRLLEGLDWRLLGGALGRRRGLRPEPLAGHGWRLTLEWDALAGSLRYA